MLGMLYDGLRRMTPPTVRTYLKQRRWFTPVTRQLFGNAVYSHSYFTDIERLEAASVERIAGWIGRELAPGTAIDVGCGPGHLMAALNRQGIRPSGVDLSRAAIQRSRAKGLSVEYHDLTSEEVLPGVPYDLAISCEVAEHLEQKHARRFVRKLCRAASTVFLTAAAPDPESGPGLFHFNEQPQDYWIELMEGAGFSLDVAATGSVRRELDDPSVVRYLRRPMVFHRRPGAR